MSYSIERVKYPDGTIVVRHACHDGEWWRDWIVAPTESVALDHIDQEYYGGPGRAFVRRAYRVDHPKKVVFVQSGGLDI